VCACPPPMVCVRVCVRGPPVHGGVVSGDRWKCPPRSSSLLVAASPWWNGSHAARAPVLALAVLIDNSRAPVHFSLYEYANPTIVRTHGVPFPGSALAHGSAWVGGEATWGSVLGEILTSNHITAATVGIWKKHTERNLCLAPPFHDLSQLPSSIPFWTRLQYRGNSCRSLLVLCPSSRSHESPGNLNFAGASDLGTGSQHPRNDSQPSPTAL
jgi:hypothetical protein